MQAARTARQTYPRDIWSRAAGHVCERLRRDEVHELVTASLVQRVMWPMANRPHGHHVGPAAATPAPALHVVARRR